MNLFIFLISVIYFFELIGIIAVAGDHIKEIKITAIEMIPLYGIHALLYYASGFFDQLAVPQYILLGTMVWGVIDSIRLHNTTVTKFYPMAMFALWLLKVIALYKGLP